MENARAMAMQQQMIGAGMAQAQINIGQGALAAGLQGGLGSLRGQGFGGGIAQQGPPPFSHPPPLPPSSLWPRDRANIPEPVGGKPKTLRQELQSETDDWLKDAL